MEVSDAFARQSTRAARYDSSVLAEAFGSGHAGTDAAGMCAGMPRPHYLAARVRWGMDVSSTRPLWACLMVEGAGVAAEAKRRGRVWRRGVLSKLVSTAIVELLEPARVASPDARRLLTGMPEEQWAKHEADYLAIRGALLRWSDAAAEYLARR